MAASQQLKRINILTLYAFATLVADPLVALYPLRNNASAEQKEVCCEWKRPRPRDAAFDSLSDEGGMQSSGRLTGASWVQ